MYAVGKVFLLGVFGFPMGHQTPSAITLPSLYDVALSNTSRAAKATVGYARHLGECGVRIGRAGCYRRTPSKVQSKEA